MSRNDPILKLSPTTPPGWNAPIGLNVIAFTIDIALVVLGFVLGGMWLFLGGVCLYSAVLRLVTITAKMVLRNENGQATKR